ncbi:MAG: DUF423 domain-containing protein [Alphaproteobacteria bacterium]|nr:DUF423 domain-containing protein [Alphaproteobacteria bacterium]MBF0391433.1 DUF423 domain-containing protein [Alphaproteobacteria bacterium]
MRPWLGIAGLSGAIAVALGAYAAHALADDPTAAATLDKAVRWQLAHALALLAVDRLDSSLPARLAGVAFTLGIVLFCGALYGIALFGLPTAPLAPFGGSAFIAGWLLLALRGFMRG